MDTILEDPQESLRDVLEKLQELGYIGNADAMIEGDRVHSGLTDLRLTESGHVARES